MTLRLTIGIDPGQTGAVCVLKDGEFAGFVDMPTMARKAGGESVNAAGLAKELREWVCAHPGSAVSVYLEAVSAMPKIPGRNGGQGASSAFRFGEGFGIVQGVIAALGLPVTMVHSSKWKRDAGLSGTEKDAARALVHAVKAQA